MEPSEFMSADRIKQECCLGGEATETYCKNINVIKGEQDNNSLGGSAYNELNNIENVELQNNGIDTKPEKEDISRSSRADEDEGKDICFNNFMNTDITIEDNIKQEKEASSSLHIKIETCTDYEVMTTTIENDVKQEKNDFSGSLNIKEEPCTDYEIEEICFNNVVDTDIVIDKQSANEHGCYKCKLCNKSFSQESILLEHSIACMIERPYECTICGKGFTQKPNLTSHFIVHDKRKGFKCKICKKAFARKSQRNKHLLIHNKRFECTVCNKSFIRETPFKQHLFIHDSIRRFKCSICGQEFVRNRSLQQHLLIHDNRRICV